MKPCVCIEHTCAPHAGMCRVSCLATCMCNTEKLNKSPPSASPSLSFSFPPLSLFLLSLPPPSPSPSPSLPPPLPLSLSHFSSSHKFLHWWHPPSNCEVRFTVFRGGHLRIKCKVYCTPSCFQEGTYLQSCT